MDTLYKECRIGTFQTWKGGPWKSVYICIQFVKGNLSITGVVGPTQAGNAVMCGQIQDELINQTWHFAKGWNRAKVKKLVEVWNKWHLNDLQAECEHQEAAGQTWETHPLAVCPKCGWKLGAGWNRREVPEDVLTWLASLPKLDREPAWI